MKSIMPFINFYKNKISLTITVLSLLSLIPLAFFYKYASELNELQQIVKLTPGQAAKVLQRTLALPELYIPFIFGLFFWIANATLTSFALARGHIHPLYAIPTLALGGLGTHFAIAIILSLPWNKIIEKLSKFMNWINVANFLAVVGVGAAVLAIPFYQAMSYPAFEVPFIGKKMKFSLDKDHPNLVEVFTDGFDIQHYDPKEYTEDDNFKEFTWFKHFATPGYPTHLSVPMIFGDFEKWNPFEIMYDTKETPDDYQSHIYADGILKSGVEHINYAQNEFSSRTLINPVGFSDSSFYGPSVSSVPKAILKEDPTLNVTNWVGARDANNGSFGVGDYPPDIQGYHWLQNNLLPASQGEKGARVYISDMITHRPFVVDDNQHFTLWDIKREDTAKSLHDALSDTINALKNIKDNSGFSAYDNSLIVVWGDHASHDYMDYQLGESASRASESSMIIKFPEQASDTKTQKFMNVIDDKFIWGPQINSIISEYFSASATQKNDSQYFNNYFNHNTKPQKFDNVSRPTFGNPAWYEWSSWKQINGEWKFTADTQNPNYRVEWADNEKEQQAQIEELRKVDY